MENGLYEQLTLGLDQLGIRSSSEQASRLLDFRTLVEKWNRIYNLTAIREPGKMISYHLLDSLSVMPHLGGSRILDVGTGPGFPGIPLSILNPDRSFVLIDSNGKKTRFVRQAAMELGLTNVQVVQERVEGFQNGLLFDTIVTRAFSTICGILASASHLMQESGRLLAMRSRLPDRETVYPGFKSKLIPIQVPGVETERHILMLTLESAKPE